MAGMEGETVDVPVLGEQDIKVTIETNSDTLVIEEGMMDDKLGMSGKDNEEEEQHITVTMDSTNNTLVIEGDIMDNKPEMPWNASQEEGGVRKHSANIKIPPGVFNTDEIQLYVTNGVLKVLLPKVHKDGKRYVSFNVPPNREEQENPLPMKGVRRSWYAEVSESGRLKVRIDMPPQPQPDIAMSTTTTMEVEGGTCCSVVSIIQLLVIMLLACLVSV